ncbi:MAG: ATP-grasp fold amidoligase family protein [Lachnospiraceae bacterium]|nr:ATP-grasp fold amidoligase family protein [Lachnospiraceae bacterium]
MPDEEYLRKRFHAARGYYMDFDNPKTFSEKLQWLKLHDHNPLYTKLVDKAEVKGIVADAIGRNYIIPTLDVWDSAAEVDFDRLPAQFVLKCTHDSHGLVICKDKSRLNIKETRKKLESALKSNYYYTFREWPYKDVKPRVLAEQYMSDDGKAPADYKIHCFNGKAKLVLLCADRFTAGSFTEDFYDCAWNHLDLKRPKVPNSAKVQEKPEQLAEMMHLAEKLAGDIPFVRVDFYIIEGKVFFGEMTFFPASGFTPFVPEEWDMTLGNWLALPAT